MPDLCSAICTIQSSDIRTHSCSKLPPVCEQPWKNLDPGLFFTLGCFVDTIPERWSRCYIGCISCCIGRVDLQQLVDGLQYECGFVTSRRRQYVNISSPRTTEGSKTNKICPQQHILQTMYCPGDICTEPHVTGQEYIMGYGKSDVVRHRRKKCAASGKV